MYTEQKPRHTTCKSNGVCSYSTSTARKQ